MTRNQVSSASGKSTFSRIGIRSFANPELESFGGEALHRDHDLLCGNGL